MNQLFKFTFLLFLFSDYMFGMYDDWKYTEEEKKLFHEYHDSLYKCNGKKFAFVERSLPRKHRDLFYNNNPYEDIIGNCKTEDAAHQMIEVAKKYHDLNNNIELDHPGEVSGFPGGGIYIYRNVVTKAELPLNLAILAGNIPVIKAMLKSGANPCSQGPKYYPKATLNTGFIWSSINWNEPARTEAPIEVAKKINNPEIMQILQQERSCRRLMDDLKKIFEKLKN